MAIGLSGCIPNPHTTTCTDGMSGHVMDADTGRPIQGASILMIDAMSLRPLDEATTDKTGAFEIDRTTNFHLITILGMCSSEWPQGEHFLTHVKVLHPGYSEIEIRPHDLRYKPVSQVDLLSDDHGEYRFDIRLKPLPKPAPAQSGGAAEDKKAP